MLWTLIDSDAVGFSDASSGHVYTYPAGAPSIDDLDVLCVNSDSVVSTPSGYTLAVSRVVSQGAYIWYRKAVGGEASTVTITTPGVNKPCAVTWSRWTGGQGLDVTAVAGVDGSSGTSTPAVTTPAITQDESLCLAFAALHSGGASMPTSPSWSAGYTPMEAVTQGTGTTGVAAFTGYKTNAGTATESPSCTWTNNISDRYILVAVFGPAADVRQILVCPSGAAHRAAGW